MEKVNNLEQAEEWFLCNHSGNVICVKGTYKIEEKEVNCYPDAEKFFRS